MLAGGLGPDMIKLLAEKIQKKKYLNIKNNELIWVQSVARSRLNRKMTIDQDSNS